LPDWETFLKFHDDPALPDIRHLDDYEIGAWSWAGVTSSVLDRVGQPSGLLRPHGPLPGLGISIGPASIAEDARNLAKGRPATQSNGDRRALRAVDGNTSGENADDSLTTLADWRGNIWWQVDLGERQSITDVQVWPRTDACCLDHLNNVLIVASDAPPISADPYVLRQQPDVSSYFVLGRLGAPTTIPIDRPARYVRIIQTAPGFLDIAEVKVWGLASEKKGGRT
jgi:hypothetical protein